MTTSLAPLVRGYTAESPEKQLVVAVLNCAAMDYLYWVARGDTGGPADVQRERHGGPAPDAIKWFASDRRQPFSFEWCCSVLDLDPWWVRSALKYKQLQEEQVYG